MARHSPHSQETAHNWLFRFFSLSFQGFPFSFFLFPFSLLLFPCSASAQETVALKESFTPGTLYHVSTRVELEGSLTLPADKGDKGGPKKLAVVGKSALDFDERVLQLDKQGQVAKTIRVYQQMDFERKVGDQAQKVTLRPEVKRMVILRHNQMEVPFSPDGALTWGEIDLVRTDVFTPALQGLLPPASQFPKGAAPGDRWSATTSAVLELTDFLELEKGALACKFDSFITLADQKLAKISFAGTVVGSTEDGASKQQIDGYLYFHVAGKYLSYLSLKGTQSLLDQDGKTVGTIEGTFVLTRQPLATAKGLADADLAKVALEPTKTNTLLLHEDPVLGVRFLYPRRWHVAGAKGTQLGLDEKNGSGILLTIEPPKQVPTGAQFLQESQQFWKKEKADILGASPVQVSQKGTTTIEHFSLDVAVGKQKFRMYYLVVRQPAGGVVVAARLQLDDLTALQEEVQQIVASMQVLKKQ